MHRIITGAVVFVSSAALAALISQASNAASVAIIAGGFLLAIIILIQPTIENVLNRSTSGEISYRGLKWEIREEPVRSVLPTEPTNSTSSAEAKQHADRGRQILHQKSKGQEVNLEDALSAFREAANLDRGYWEAQLNIAGVLLLKGDVEASLATAVAVKTRFSHIPLAYAKANLIIAKIEEMRISESDSEEQQSVAYKNLASLLEDSLLKCEDHTTTRISLGRVYILSGCSKDKMVSFLNKSMEYQDFSEKFMTALQAESLAEIIESEYPQVYNRLNVNREQFDG